MGSEDRRGGRGSADDELEGRDLLVGRPQGAEVRPGAGTEQSPAAATSSQPGAHVENIREILETVLATAAKIDALEAASGSDPENEKGDALANERTALARETAALTGAKTVLAGERAALAGERAALALAIKAARGSLAKIDSVYELQLRRSRSFRIIRSSSNGAEGLVDMCLVCALACLAADEFLHRGLQTRQIAKLVVRVIHLLALRPRLEQRRDLVHPRVAREIEVVFFCQRPKSAQQHISA